MTFTKDPSTHPANVPLTEDRLIRVRDELAAAAKRSDGGNLGYMMADAAKAIDELLAVREAGQEPVADVVAWHHQTEERTCDIRLRRHDLTPGPLYAAPQLPQPAVQNMHHDAKCDLFRPQVVNGVFVPRHCDCRAALQQGAEPVSKPYTLPDGYCVMPFKLTAENGAKGVLSGEFHVTNRIVCQSCGGEGCEDCNDEGGWDAEIPVSWDIIKRIHEAAVEACSLPAAPQQEVKSALEMGMTRYGDAMQKLADGGD